MNKPDFKEPAKQYAGLLTLPTDLLQEACKLDFEAGCNYCYNEIAAPLVKQNAEYVEALRELKRFIPSLRVLVDRQFNEPQNCFDLFDEIEAMKL